MAVQKRKRRPFVQVIHKKTEPSIFAGQTWEEHYTDLIQGVQSVVDDPAPVDPYDFYAWFFGFEKDSDIVNSIQTSFESPKSVQMDSKGKVQEVKLLKPNPLVYSVHLNPDGTTQGRYGILFKDTWRRELGYAMDQSFAITNLMAYYGRKNLLGKMGVAYGLIIDLDGIDGQRVDSLIETARKYPDLYPIPNAIALSGTGIHLYYAFTRPLVLTQDVKEWLKYLKNTITVKVWNKYTSIIDKPQMQGISQGFRCCGSSTKIEGLKVLAWWVTKERWEVYGKDGLEQYITDGTRKLLSDKYYEPRHPLVRDEEDGHLSFEKAKLLYPEWAARVEEEKAKGLPHVVGGGRSSEHFYEFWKKEIKINVAVGFRYFSILTLAYAARKCDIPYEKLQEDADELQVQFDLIGGRAAPFTKDDEEAALRGYNDPRAKRYTFRFMCARAGVDYKPKKETPKLEAWYQMKELEAAMRGEVYEREHMTREKWLEVYGRPMAKIAALKNPKKWWEYGGKPTSDGPIREWLEKHPYGRRLDCQRELGLCDQTMRKYWIDCGGMKDGTEAFARYIEDHPKAKSKEIAEAIGYDIQHVYRLRREYKASHSAGKDGAVGVPVRKGKEDGENQS